MILLLGVGFFAGIISGMGIGGGTILIPALIFLNGESQQSAQIMNLLYFVPTAAIALFTHTKNDKIEKKILLWLIVFGVTGAVAGAFIAVKMDSAILKKMFGGFLLLMGVLEMKKKSTGRTD